MFTTVNMEVDYCQHPGTSSRKPMPAPRNRKRRPYHHGDLRRALLDATLELAAERGAAGVTLREAARTARVSQTAPYRHFADKQAMLAAAAEEGFRLYDRQLQAALAAAGEDPRAQLLGVGEVYVRFALEQPAYFRLMYGQGSPPKSASPGLQQAARDAFQVFHRTVERCLATTSAEGSVNEAMSRLWALAHGIASLALEKQILFDLEIETLIRTTRDAISELFASVARPSTRTS